MLYIAYFSPTGTTRRIAASVGKALFETFLCRTQVVDLTPPAARLRGRTFAEEDVVVFGAPVYGGRVPPLLLPALRLWNGGGAKAVVLSVYGNRDFDDALLETKDLFEERGFTVCAAAAFRCKSRLRGAARTRRTAPSCSRPKRRPRPTRRSASAAGPACPSVRWRTSRPICPRGAAASGARPASRPAARMPARSRTKGSSPQRRAWSATARRAARRRCFYNKKSVFYNKRSAG